MHALTSTREGDTTWPGLDAVVAGVVDVRRCVARAQAAEA